MKALVLTGSREVAENISAWFQLRWPGATLFSVASGSEGIEVLDTEWPDVVILDLDSPGMDGFDVLEQIRLFSDVPLVALTSCDTATTRPWALEVGADACIVKPVSRVELLARVVTLLRRSRVAQLKGGCLIPGWQMTWRDLTNPMSSYSAN